MRKPLWYVWQLGSYRAWLFLASCFLQGVVFYLVPLLPGLIMQQILNGITQGESNLSGLWGLCALLVGIAIARFSFLFIGMSAEITMNVTLASLLRRNLFVNVLKRPGAQALPASSGDAISRFRDDTMEIGNFVCWLGDPLGQLMVVIVALSILIHISVLITLVVFVPLLIVLVVFQAFKRRVQQYQEANQAAISDVTGLLGDVFGAVQTVKVANAEQHVVNHFKTLNEARRKAALRNKFINQVIGAVSGLLCTSTLWVYSTGAAPVQSDVEGEYSSGSAGRTSGPARGVACGGVGARYSGIGAAPGDKGRATRCQAFWWTGATQCGGAYVCAERGTSGC